jgi:type II secretory pathway predicted ATPase ExeA/cell division protein FtsN
MYQDYFGLNTLPFENTPDPDFFFMGARYRETLALMIHSVISRKGLICITGSVGTGKTTLSRVLTSHLPEKTIVISLVHPKAKPAELTSFVAHSLKLKQTPDSPLLLNELIRDELIKTDEAGGRCVLIIDEAQFMSDELFQEVLFFTNLETSQHKLIQIFLFGQKELLDKLNRPEMRQLSQRISVTKFLRSMDRNQSIQYIKHRLIRAGGSPDIFSDEALDLIVINSGGIPRVVNRICDATLLKAFMLQKETAETAEVQMAISDLGLDLRSGPHKPIRMNVYRRQVLPRQDSSDTHAGQASRMASGEDDKSSQKEEEKTAPSGRGHRYKGLKFVLILGVIVFLVAGIIRHLGMHGSEKTETDKSPSYMKEKISNQIAEKEPNTSPVQAINDKSLGPINVEEGSGAAANGQDITVTQQTHSQTGAAIQDKEALNKEEKTAPQISPQKTERPEEKRPDTQETRVTYPYSVLLSSYRALENAQRALEIYRKMGLSGFWVRVDLGDDNVWYRVLTGHFKGREEAEAFIKEKGLVEARSKKIEYANLVGVYISDNALNAKLLELSRLGYCPYIIKGIKGASHLYAGAFYTKQGAETQCSELITDGIQCQVVEQ